MPYRCCVKWCKYEIGEIMHSFPKDPELFRKWCTAIGREDLCRKPMDTVRKSYRVCNKHFDADSQFRAHHNRTNLKVGSIPSINIHGTGVPPAPARPIAAAAALHKGDECDVAVPVAWDTPSTSRMETDAAMGKPPCKRRLQGATGDTLSSATTAMVPTSKRLCPGRASPAVQCSTEVEQCPHKPRKRRVPRVICSAALKKRNLLHAVNLRSKAQLTPKAKKLYELATEYRHIAKKLDYTMAGNQERLEKALECAENCEVLQSKVNKATYTFLQCQIGQQVKAPRGRRFSLDDKIFALAIMKQVAARGYRLLRQIFALPSRKTLADVVRKVPFDCGINKPIFANLKEDVAKMKPLDRHCVVMADEMSLAPLLQYNHARQCIDGFQDTSDANANVRIADHAMVFMVRGLARTWKQPIAYYFTQNGMSNPDIAKTLKDIIRHLHATGLHVEATVCDQYNKAAINLLVEETRIRRLRDNQEHNTYTFMVDDKEIIPFFDFPHLLKCIRNNMLKYDVSFTWKNGREMASWDHIEILYALDDGDTEFRMLAKLTDEHVIRTKVKKMKVKHAAQVFSQRVQAVMRGLLKHGNTQLPGEAVGTANFLLFMNKLFDSVNGSAITPYDGNVLRRAVTASTGHMAFWNEAIKVLSSVKFVSPTKEFVPPSVTNWIISLKNMKLLWTHLQTQGFTFLLPRSVNQDPLENFFGCIRSHGVRNINPSCSQFRTAFKSLIINNFMASHSANSNCERDDSEGALSTLKKFLLADSPVTEGVIPLDYADDKQIALKPVNDQYVLNVHGYIAGYMVKNILRAMKGCRTCRTTLAATCDAYCPVEYELIEAREYKRGALLRPRTKFVVLLGLCMQVVKYFMPRICHERNLPLKLLSILHRNISSDIFNGCPEHTVFTLFLTTFVKFYCYSWTTHVNQVLKGQSQKVGNDVIKQQALRLHNKYRVKKRTAQQQKHLT